MNIRYHVELSEAERGELTALVGGGKHYARKIKRADLLAADSGLSDDDIAAALAVGGSTVTGPSVASLKAISKPP